ncbi:MAG: chemotaxis response regulator protein-glutamate methylesterase [Candidatus Delongbacteria bacterium]|nr:chemotaxis response regulator protein-glutamate methylesterase [Candidatus Delongbacteria bacterium]MBN2834410.1 chemotaxis response regulator protein-glutamate methylesterase [Candidatus Delongbacteria bacterium]
MNEIKILIVDDSAFMRKALSMMLEDHSDLKVVGTCTNGIDAVNFVRDNAIDIVTLDIEMPKMDGLSALKQILEIKPIPVIMISSLTTEGASHTIEALELGAVDFIPKNMSFISHEIMKIKEELIEKIRYFHKNSAILARKISIASRLTKIRKSHIDRPLDKGSSTLKSTNTYRNTKEIVVIGSSTGGPAALQKIIPLLPKDLPVPVLIVQHMPPGFTASLAERLNSLSELDVKEVVSDTLPKKGCVYVSPGGKQTVINSRKRLEVRESKVGELYKPCIDTTFLSINEVYRGRVLAVILTGMGSDGTEGLKKIHENNGFIIGQNQESCVVYGMPKEANETGLSNVVVDLSEIAKLIIENC